MKWDEIRSRPAPKLNIGGYDDGHPKPGYEKWISVDTQVPTALGIEHDLTEKFPIENSTVSAILSEHFFEHITYKNSCALLAECHRILKAEGTMRIAVPDYGAPRNKKYALRGHDPHHTDHLQFPDIYWARRLCFESPFSKYKITNYWEEGEFYYATLDYSIGWVKRTADNDKRNKRHSCAEKSLGVLRDFATMIRYRVGPSHAMMETVRGRRYRMTSIIIDLVKT